MTIKVREPQFRPRYGQFVLHGLASPFTFLELFADIHLAESPEEADARALSHDWEIVGECLEESLVEYSRLLETSGKKYDR